MFLACQVLLAVMIAGIGCAAIVLVEWELRK